MLKRLSAIKKHNEWTHYIILISTNNKLPTRKYNFPSNYKVYYANVDFDKPLPTLQRKIPSTLTVKFLDDE